MHRIDSRSKVHSRKGSLSLWFLISGFVILAGVALALNRFWMETAQQELTKAAEAAALGGARRLADDEIFMEDFSFEARSQLARNSAATIASNNIAAGSPVVIDPSPGGDIRLGVKVDDPKTNETLFVETDFNPSTVQVFVHRDRSRSNPVATILSVFLGQNSMNISTSAKATIDNRITGLKPLEGIHVPAVPMALLSKDPAGKRMDTWMYQIELRQGTDQFGYDSQEKTVVTRPDGIPEMVVNLKQDDSPGVEANLHLIDFRSGWDESRFRHQLQNGLTVEDFLDIPDGLQLSPASPVAFPASKFLSPTIASEIQEITGKRRIFFLYEQYEEPTGSSSQTGTVHCTGFVAARIMEIRQLLDQSWQLTIQPTVITTKTAQLFKEGSGQPSPTQTQSSASGTSQISGSSDRSDTVPRNRYIYKLHLTK